MVRHETILHERQDERQAAEGGEVGTAPACAFPGCRNPPEPKAIGTPGPAPKYCGLGGHNPLTAWRARRRQGSQASGDESIQHPPERAVTSAAASASLARETVLAEMAELRTDLDRYTVLLQKVGEPELARAQMLAVESDAQTRISIAEQRADTEHSRRVSAEVAARAAEAARADAEEVADQAVDELDAARVQFEAELARLAGEAEAAVGAARAAAGHEVQRISDEAGERVAQAESRAAGRIEAAEQAADHARSGAARQIEEVTVLLDEERKAAAEAVLAAAAAADDARDQARAAGERARAAEERARVAEDQTRSAQEAARRAAGDAQARVESVESWAGRLQQELRLELDRALAASGQLSARAGALETRVDELRNQLDAARAELGSIRSRVEG